MKYAVKRLAAVEVAAPHKGKRKRSDVSAPSGTPTSNQHEFNAGALRTALDLPEVAEGQLSLLFFTADDVAPAAETSKYTMYNARKKKADKRGPEYRLYYYAKDALHLHGRAGDLFLLFREGESNDLVGIVVRAGTRVEAEILAALEVDPSATLSRFTSRTQTSLRVDVTDIATASMTTTAVQDAAHVDIIKSRAAYMQPIIDSALANGKIPQARTLSAASQGFVVEQLDNLTADEFIQVCLEEESTLFFAVEQAVNQPELDKMVARGVSLSEILSWSLRLQQSRKSRRGQSLQFHLESLLKREGIPHKSQCVTEHGEKPDFVVPGEADYRDAKFPNELLRMVACKTTVRERWSQVSREAERIAEKYLLTVDPQMPREVIENVARHNIKLFVPASVIEERGYVDVENVQMMIDRLRSAVEQAKAWRAAQPTP